MKRDSRICPICHGSGLLLEHERIGNALRELRLSYGIEAQAVAAKMRVTPSYICYLEQGQRKWTKRLRDRYESALNKINSKPKQPKV